MNNIRVPKTYLFLTKIEEFKIDELKDIPCFVVKPNMASCGFDVYNFIKINQESYMEISGRRHDWIFIKEKIKKITTMYNSGGCLIEETIKNPKEFDIFTMGFGIIDLRLYMLNDEILYGKLRVPNHESEGYANTGRKADALFVNKDGIIVPDDIFNNTTTICSKRDFKGVKVPFWKELSETSIYTAKLFKLKFHSIDISMNENYEPCIMESEKIPYLGHYTDKGCIELINLLNQTK